MKTKTYSLILLFLCFGLSSCSSDDDNNDNAIEICNNGIDDDSDGLIDCDDPDCAEADACAELNSDYRLKDNISALKYGLNEVLQLDTKTYTYKSDESSEKRMGFIAQDVQSVMPELVLKDKSTKQLKLKYMDVIAVLTKAIQEQQKIIEANQQQIEKLTCESNKQSDLK